MIKIYSDGDIISYSLGDTFSLEVESPDGFEEGTRLKFQVAENEENEMIVDSVFEQQNGEFKILLTEEETSRFKLGSYIYRITILHSDRIITQKSGELAVRWGV